MWHFKTLRFWQLKSHKKKHNSVCHPCIECDYLATNTTALLYHNKSNHQNSVYNCDRCNFTAKVSETLRDHKISKHNNIYQSCDEYGNLTKNTFALCYHKKSNHQNTVYNCDQCDFIAKRLWHTETQNIIRHPCDQCDHFAKNAPALYYHKRSKHQNMTFPCNQCGHTATISKHWIFQMKKWEKMMRSKIQHIFLDHTDPINGLNRIWDFGSGIFGI